AVSHSGYGGASDVSYVQRRHSKGGVPPSSCEEIGKKIQVPYTAQYLFWSQDQSFTQVGIPSEISTDSDNLSPPSGFYAEGYQHYRFNGSSWINFNATSFLYTSPGKQVVGNHYYLAQADENGGRPTWKLFNEVRVTTRAVSRVTVEEDSIDWVKLEATSYGGNYGQFMNNRNINILPCKLNLCVHIIPRFLALFYTHILLKPDKEYHGPVLSMPNKRLRFVQKKFNRILQIEERRSQGKAINKEKEDVLMSKLTISILIDDHEKLKKCLSMAIKEELISREKEMLLLLEDNNENENEIENPTNDEVVTIAEEEEKKKIVVDENQTLESLETRQVQEEASYADVKDDSIVEVLQLSGKKFPRLGLAGLLLRMQLPIK
ncbi:hypothetical protein KI387_012466, partial [Taxus chinensis]